MIKNSKILVLLLGFAFVLVLTGIAQQQKSEETVTCPVSGEVIKKSEAKGTYEYKGKTYYFCCENCKEAFIKAKGKGLSIPLNQFDVSLAVDEPVALLNVKDDPDEALRWSLYNLDVGSEYKAALAVEGHHWQLKCWKLEEENIASD